MTQDADFAAAICEALTSRKAVLARQFRQAGPIRHFVVDGLLPPDLALEAYRAFPDSARRIRATIRPHHTHLPTGGCLLRWYRVWI